MMVSELLDDKESFDIFNQIKQTTNYVNHKTAERDLLIDKLGTRT